MNGNIESYLNLILLIAIIGAAAYFGIRLVWPRSSDVSPFPKATAKRGPLKWKDIEDDAKSDESEDFGIYETPNTEFEAKPFRQARPRSRSGEVE